MIAKGLWVHERSMDVVYEVRRFYDVHKDYIKVKYVCHAKNYDGSLRLLNLTPLKAKVYKKDLKGWKRYFDG